MTRVLFLLYLGLGVFLETGYLTVELYTKFCIDPYSKREFHKKSRVVSFSIAGRPSMFDITIIGSNMHSRSDNNLYY